MSGRDGSSEVYMVRLQLQGAVGACGKGMMPDSAILAPIYAAILDVHATGPTRLQFQWLPGTRLISILDVELFSSTAN